MFRSHDGCLLLNWIYQLDPGSHCRQLELLVTRHIHSQNVGFANLSDYIELGKSPSYQSCLKKIWMRNFIFWYQFISPLLMFLNFWMRLFSGCLNVTKHSIFCFLRKWNLWSMDCQTGFSSFRHIGWRVFRLGCPTAYCCYWSWL